MIVAVAYPSYEDRHEKVTRTIHADTLYAALISGPGREAAGRLPGAESVGQTFPLGDVTLGEGGFVLL